jgi:hypothetical protein
MHGAGDQIDHEEQENGDEPPGVVHIEEVEKVQHLIQTDPVSLNIFRTGGILCDHRADDGKDGKQNEERNGKFERPKKVIDDGKETTFFLFSRVSCFFHNILLININIDKF